ncbi:MAG: extracellular solute-binding protein [Rhizobiaceae bacterium]|nr:extracellular solute-binding protein [Rhizobiaceae bacterium]
MGAGSIGRRALLSGVGLAVVSSLCGPAVAQQGATLNEGVWRSISAMSSLERTAKLVEGAAQEGDIVVYGVLGIDRAQILTEHFKKLYSNLNISFVRMTTAQIAQKLQAERDAGSISADIIIYDLILTDRLKEFLAPYEPVSWDDFDPRFRYGSAAEGWTGLVYEILPYAIAWRTDKVPLDKAPRSFQALIDGDWNGRVGSILNMEPIVDGFLQIYGDQEGMKWVEALGELNSVLYPSIGALSGALSSGEIDIAWNIGAYRAAPLKASGAPIDFEFENPTFATGLSVSIAKGSSHPYGAALFMEYLTDAKVLEVLDPLEPGRAFANRAGNYTNSIIDFANLHMQRPLTDEDMGKLSPIVERTFLRR